MYNQNDMNNIQDKINNFKKLTGVSELTETQLEWISNENSSFTGQYKRRSGSTLAHAGLCAIRAQDEPGSIQAIFSPTLAASKSLMKIMTKFNYDKATVLNETDNTLKFENGSVVQFKNIEQLNYLHGIDLGKISADMSNDKDSLQKLHQAFTIDKSRLLVSMCVD